MLALEMKTVTFSDRAYSIVTEEARRAGIRVSHLRFGQRSRAMTAVRSRIAQRLRAELNLSYPQIGYVLAKDHTTVISYFRTAEDKLRIAYARRLRSAQAVRAALAPGGYNL